MADMRMLIRRLGRRRSREREGLFVGEGEDLLAAARAAGPTTAEIPQTAPKSPCTRARVSSSKMSPIMVMATGCTAPAPRPGKVRKRISAPMLCEVPASTLPNRNRKMPARYTGFLPYVSDSLPTSSVLSTSSGVVVVCASSTSWVRLSDSPPKLSSPVSRLGALTPMNTSVAGSTSASALSWTRP